MINTTLFTVSQAFSGSFLHAQLRVDLDGASAVAPLRCRLSLTRRTVLAAPLDDPGAGELLIAGLMALQPLEGDANAFGCRGAVCDWVTDM